MDTIRSTPELSQVYTNLGREYGVPILGHKAVTTVGLGGSFPFPGPEGQLGRAVEHYRRVIVEAKPDEVTIIVIHPALESEELKAAMGDGRFGAPGGSPTSRRSQVRSGTRSSKQQRIQLVNWKHVKTLFGAE